MTPDRKRRDSFLQTPRESEHGEFNRVVLHERSRDRERTESEQGKERRKVPEKRGSITRGELGQKEATAKPTERRPPGCKIEIIEMELCVVSVRKEMVVSGGQITPEP